uniref:NADH dehydrogenase subunit 6 n=1 Tax=Megacopta cribraria TaxID=299257 RepID=F2YJ80_MEGCI|nr:NADH dehydrogenase subunit 6 [Megacopta cribraria]ADZ23061.1 NADH dehydrogenase subunit 6 [Megacopta cribraria]UYA97613.1 NADH dehydrogenase subunit 6 [Megacopta cribraria]UYA97626.1 NADH dehydrogenase subunit 6 [Megacopta cribraria]UYA97639.1 NADH dehydrogenase subunit 6 [Megacopta cribraria]
MMQMMLSMMTALSVIMMFMKHPLSMGMILIAQTLVIAITTGMMVKTFFFSYIVTIIMMSGALVLFIYMASVASNEKFNPSIKIAMMFMMTIATTWMMKTSEIHHNMQSQEIKMVVKMFNMTNAFMTMMMILYLLFTMITASSIANIKEGPLRMKT